MEFLKKNYEKLILSIVLLGLAAAAALLPSWVSEEKQRLNDILNPPPSRNQPKEFKPLNLTTNEAILRRARRPEPLKLAGEHPLFNPVQWKRLPDGNLIKIVTGDEFGAGALRVTEIRPLNTTVSYEGQVGTNEFVQYRFKITREAERSPNKRAATTRSVPGVGIKNDIFTLKEMRPKEDPREFVLELVDGRQLITVTREKPYSGVAGYMADLKYDPEKSTFLGKRVDDRLVFSGDANKIVAITETNVTVEALSNTKRTTLPYREVPK
jgi:hypothetical protein